MIYTVLSNLDFVANFRGDKIKNFTKRGRGGYPELDPMVNERSLRVFYSFAENVATNKRTESEFRLVFGCLICGYDGRLSTSGRYDERLSILNFSLCGHWKI